MTKKKVQITRGTAINGTPVFPGEIHEVDESTARELFYCNKAVLHVEPPVPAPPDESIKPSEEADAPTDKRRRRK